MYEISQNLLSIFSRCFLAFVICWVVFKASLILFNFSIQKEIKNGNQAAAFFWIGFVLMIGLIVSLVKI